jgi:hypothetical protein
MATGFPVNRAARGFFEGDRVVIRDMVTSMRGLALLVSSAIGCGFSPAVIDGHAGDDQLGSDAHRDDGAMPDSTASVAFVQSTQKFVDNQSSTQLAWTNAQVAGDLSVVVVGWNDPSRQLQDIHDDRGGTFVQVGTKVFEDPFSEVMFVVADIAAGTNAITVTFDQSVARIEMRVLQYRGLATQNPVDVEHGAHSNTGTVTDSGAATTTHWHDMIVGCNIVGAATTSMMGPGFTQRMIIDGDACEDKEVTTAASYSATATQSSSNSWTMQMVALRAAD